MRNSEQHNERGIELASRGFEQEALLEFERAILKDQNFAPAYDNIAHLYADRGEHIRALQIYLKALELDPEDSTIHYNFGCFLTNYATEMAIAEYQIATQSESEFPEAHLNLGVSFMSLGRLTEALEELELAVKLDPNDAAASYELACARLELGQFKEAVSELRKATQKDAKHQAAWFLLGSCYLQQGFYTEANTALMKALDLEPNDALCLCEIAGLRFAEGQEKDSATLLKKALRLDRIAVTRRIQKNPHLSSLARIFQL